MGPLQSAFGATLTVVSSASQTPQLRRGWVRRHLADPAAGVSAATLSLSAISLIGYVGYAAAVSNTASLISASVGAVVVVTILIGYSAAGHRPARHGGAVVAAAAGATSLAVLADVPAWALGAVATATYAVVAVPQMRLVVNATDTLGVSRAAWTLMCARDIGWVIWATWTQDWWIGAPCVLTIPMQLIVLNRTRRPAHHRRTPTARADESTS